MLRATMIPSRRLFSSSTSTSFESTVNALAAKCNGSLQSPISSDEAEEALTLLSELFKSIADDDMKSTVDQEISSYKLFRVLTFYDKWRLVIKDPPDGFNSDVPLLVMTEGRDDLATFLVYSSEDLYDAHGPGIIDKRYHDIVRLGEGQTLLNTFQPIADMLESLPKTPEMEPMLWMNISKESIANQLEKARGRLFDSSMLQALNGFMLEHVIVSRGLARFSEVDDEHKPRLLENAVQLPWWRSFTIGENSDIVKDSSGFAKVGIANDFWRSTQVNLAAQHDVPVDDVKVATSTLSDILSKPDVAGINVPIHWQQDGTITTMQIEKDTLLQKQQ